MNKEEIIEFLVRKALLSNIVEEINCPNEASLFDLSNEDWAEIYYELVAQTIEGLPCEWVLEHVSVPGNIRSRWVQSRIRQVALFYRLLQEQSELCQLMKDHGIPMVIMKGMASAMYYPDPSVRSMGDIDFLVHEADYQRAFQVMKDNGYQPMDERDNTEHHFVLKKDGIVYELHYKPVGMEYITECDYLMDLLEDGLQKAEDVDVESYLFPVFPDVQNGVILLLHIVQHLKSGLGLRQIIDWMMYVRHKLHDADWYGKMQMVYKKTELVTMAKAVTRMCQLYLGLEEKEITWCEDADEAVCRELMQYIMQQGNFGRKVAMKDRSVKIIGQVRNPLQFFRLLQKNGQAKWTLAKKYPVFKYVAWIYMLCRYTKKYVQSKATLKTLVSDVKAGNERRKLFARLDIYKNVRNR